MTPFFLSVRMLFVYSPQNPLHLLGALISACLIHTDPLLTDKCAVGKLKHKICLNCIGMIYINLL